MQLTISDAEKEYLEEMLTENYKTLLHELHHTDSSDYKELLLSKTEVSESLMKKIGIQFTARKQRHEES